MCKFKDILKSGYEDFCAQKKKNRISFVLIMLSLLIFVGVNSAVNTIMSVIDTMIYYPESRIASHSFTAEEGDRFDELKEMFEDDERIRDVFRTANFTLVDWIGTKEFFGDDKVSVKIESFYEPLLDYVDDEAVTSLEYGEVLVPKYVYELGKYDINTYYEGDKLVGKTIEIVYYDYYEEPMKTFELKVVGTYDNVATRITDDCLYVNDELMEEIHILEYEAELACADDYREQLIESGMDPDSYVVEYNGRMGIYVDEKYDMDEVLNDIYTEKGLYFSKSVEVAMETYSFYNYVSFVANITSFFLLVIAFINILISSVNEVKVRNWEFALKLSMGYTYKDIIYIFFVEKVINMLKSLVFSLVIIGILSVAATLLVQNLAGRDGSMFSFGLDMRYVLLAIVLVIVAAFSGVISARKSLKDIQVAVVLKSGD